MARNRLKYGIISCSDAASSWELRTRLLNWSCILKEVTWEGGEWGCPPSSSGDLAPVLAPWAYTLSIEDSKDWLVFRLNILRIASPACKCLDVVGGNSVEIIRQKGLELEIVRASYFRSSLWAALF